MLTSSGYWPLVGPFSIMCSLGLALSTVTSCSVKLLLWESARWCYWMFPDCVSMLVCFPFDPSSQVQIAWVVLANVLLISWCCPVLFILHGLIVVLHIWGVCPFQLTNPSVGGCPLEWGDTLGEGVFLMMHIIDLAFSVGPFYMLCAPLSCAQSQPAAVCSLFFTAAVGYVIVPVCDN